VPTLKHTTRIKNYQGSVVSPNGQNKDLVASLKEMEMKELPGKEFKTALLRKSSKLQENTQKQFRKLLEKFNKQVDII
jgi:hypothetical protein